MSTLWPKVPLKYLVSKIGSGKTPKGGAEVYAKSGVMLLRSQNVHFDGLRLDDVVFIDEVVDEEMASTRVTPRDVLLNITGASIGRCTVVPEQFDAANVNQHVCIIRSKPERLSPDYLGMVLQSDFIQTAIRVSENGSSREGLTFEQIGAFEIPLPPLEVQETLVSELGSKLEVVSSAITTKQHLLNLLAEKRRAVIADFLTKGPNKDAPRRDTDIPWLSEIPAHWQVERAKWLFTERDDRSDSGDEELLTVSHLTGVTSRSEKDVNMFMAESLEGYKCCQSGDLVINTLWAWMGAMGIARQSGIVSPAYNVYQPVAELDPEYVDLLVRTPRFVEEITRYSKGVWSSRLRLYPEGLYEAWLPVPPLDEQQVIVKHVQIETQRLDALASATERTITLLQERRSALISAAVSGSLDMNLTYAS
nr:restriction endonuclease subunit S [uncultured Pseudogulbenkiania sp.]